MTHTVYRWRLLGRKHSGWIGTSRDMLRAWVKPFLRREVHDDCSIRGCFKQEAKPDDA